MFPAHRLHLNPPCDCMPDTSWNTHVEEKTSGMYARLTERKPFTSCGGFSLSPLILYPLPSPLSRDCQLFRVISTVRPSLSIDFDHRSAFNQRIMPFNASTLSSIAFLSQVRRIDGTSNHRFRDVLSI